MLRQIWLKTEVRRVAEQKMASAGDPRARSDGASRAISSAAASVSVPAIPMVFLVDAGALGDVAQTGGTGTPWAPVHHLDTVDRVLACHWILRERHPEARLLIFLEGGGYNQICAEWKAGNFEAVDPAVFHSVPFGCSLCAVVLELARAKAAEGQQVVVVSNDVDVVIESRIPGTMWRHQGFMFVEGDLVLPGFASRRSSGASAAARLHSRGRSSSSMASGVGTIAIGHHVRRTISKSRLGSHLRRGAQPGLPGSGAIKLERARRAVSRDLAMEDEDVEFIGGDDGETLRDSQLDGVSAELDSSADYAMQFDGEEAFADTIVDVPHVHFADIHYADTLVDMDLGPADVEDAQTLVVADNAESSTAEVGAEATASPKDVAVAHELHGALDEVAGHVSEEVTPEGDGEETPGRSATPSDEAKDFPKQIDDQTATLAAEAPPGAASASQPPSHEQRSPGEALAEPGATDEPSQRHANPPAASQEQSGEKSLSPEMAAEVLLGPWVRDGGRTHEVVRVPQCGPAEGFLEFRPIDGARTTGMPIVREGGSWVLNSFRLICEESSTELLRWCKPSTGAVRTWRRGSVTAKASDAPVTAGTSGTDEG
mmetsp:Transcript_2108/g.4806  ORF Transcript_2108/g.4806 Transcript_2108/m.4806 type:complete len:600 (+) Transcript_2108:3-1802(+)